MKPKSNHFSQRKASLVTSHTQTRGEKVASTAINTSSTTTAVVNTNVQVQVQLVKSRSIIVLLKYIPRENQCGSEHRGEILE